ncbi:NAD-dependent succinate-semialdehyde dehydrogenase [Phenylobacterium sp.]|uniref:NAD-dependent succinate-semialdehyde dehydrogenase n=1 Tax=Phenylobacterium sp. TaxID=1871053 RepID=UPI00374C93F3
MQAAETLLRETARDLFVGGVWRPASGGATFGVENPATGEAIAQVADATEADAKAAMDACVAAQPAWAATAPRRRSEILTEAWRRMLAAEDDLAMLMTLEMGKSLEESRGEVRYAAEFFRWFAEEAVRISGRFELAPDGSARLLTLRQPVGPCVLVTPWNFPLAMGARKIGPAIAAGCTMTVKPAQQTPLSMLALAGILEASGLPAGVLNVLPCARAAEIVAVCLDHPGARKVSFTGSTVVGRTLARHAGERLLRMSMELGGDNPFLVFADADLEAAVDGAMLAKMRNIGEACTAANRFFVASSVATEFSERLARRMAAQTVGPGLSGAQVGPLIDERARSRVAELVRAAIDGGARVLTGGAAPEGPGYFFTPTVLVDVPASAEILHTEIFGPVATIQTFETEAEAVSMSNATPVGLAAYVYTRDLARALRVTEALEVGMVGLNRGVVSNPAAPFGGIKASGLGREGGREGIDEYLSVKFAAIAV